VSIFHSFKLFNLDRVSCNKECNSNAFKRILIPICNLVVLFIISNCVTLGKEFDYVKQIER